MLQKARVADVAEERLQKIIASAGIASRRKAEELITQGRVTVNGQVVTELGSKADPDRDHIKVDGKLLHGPERHVYLLLNKPKGYVTTVSDPEGRPTVMDLVKHVGERIYPVGRLDYASEGLLLMTNDGELVNFLTRASSHVPKTYLVKVAGQPAEEDLEKLRGGIRIGSKPGARGMQAVRTAPAQVRVVREADNPWYEVTLIEGKHRQIRRMFEEIGHHVEKIKRVKYGPLSLDVEPGQFRELAPKELASLRKPQPKFSPPRPEKTAARASTRHIGKAGLGRRREEQRFKGRREAGERPKFETEFRPRREAGERGERPRMGRGFRKGTERRGATGFPPRGQRSEQPRSETEFHPGRETGERGERPRMGRGFHKETERRGATGFPPRGQRSEQPRFETEFRPGRETSERGERPRMGRGFRKGTERRGTTGFPPRGKRGEQPKSETGFRPRREEGGRSERPKTGRGFRKDRGPSGAGEFPPRKGRGERSERPFGEARRRSAPGGRRFGAGGFPERKEHGETAEGRSGNFDKRSPSGPRKFGGAKRRGKGPDFRGPRSRFKR